MSARRLVSTFAAAALALVALAPAVHAQSTASSAAQTPVVEVDRWNITAFLGPGFGADLNNSPLSVGVAGAYHLTSRFALEGELAYTRSAQQGVLFDLDTGVTSLSANAIYHFANTGWVPYGVVGIGMLRGSTNLDDLASLGLTGAQVVALGLDSDGSSTSLGLNFGGGVKRRVTDRVNFRGDLRYFSGDDLAPSFWRAYAGLGFLLGR